MSVQLTEARMALAAAEQALANHDRGCPDCASKARGRVRCRRGNILIGNRARAANARRAEADAERQPHPDQEALF